MLLATVPWVRRANDVSEISLDENIIFEKSQELTLAPWQPVIDRQLGKEVAGIVQCGSVSWQTGRPRGLGL